MSGATTKPPLRVALLVTDLEPGGTPLRMARLARELHERGVDVHVGCLAPPGPVSAALERDGVSTFACGAHGPRDLEVLVRLSRHLRRIRPDLVHATLTHANVAARVVGAWCRMPVVTSTATVEVERGWHRTVERLTRGLDRGHIVNSRTLAAHVVAAFGRVPDRVFQVPPMLSRRVVPLDRAAARAGLGLPAGAFVVAWAGRFDPVKRVEIVAACAERMGGADTRFLLAGDGPLRSAIETLVRAGPAADRVQLLGWQDDLTPVLSAADVFLFPSLTEGMPNVVLEALACGVPVVASDIPVLREIAGDDEHVALVTVDDVGAYVQRLHELGADPVRRAARSRAARRWANAHLRPGATADAVLRVYRQVLGGGAAPGRAP